MNSRPREQEAEKRKGRMRAVIDGAKRLGQFSLVQLKATVNEQQAVFVTRTVKLLEQEGLLQVASEKPRAWTWSAQVDGWDHELWLERQTRGDQIQAAPEHDRPRERLIRLGVRALKLSELLAILIRSGRQGESALQAGERVASHFAGRLHRLPDASRTDLKSVSKAISETAWCQIMAGIELGRRIADEIDAHRPPIRISGTADAVAYCEHEFRRLITDGAKEEFHIVCLDTKNQVTGHHQISVGTLDASLVHPREVFRKAISEGAASILLVHNHPSGDSAPSRQDREVTQRLEEAGKLIGIRVLDHVIVAAQGSVCLRDCG